MQPTDFFPKWLRGLILGFAAVAFAVGVIAVFVTSNDTGTAALLAVSVVLLALAIFADRISSIEAGGMKLVLVAAEQLARADAAAGEGRDADAARLRESAKTLLAMAGPVSSDLEKVRRTMTSSWERVATLEALMSQARTLANTDISAQDVRRLFYTNTEGNRITAIGIMQARPELADMECLTDSVHKSRSAFEQYQALRAVSETVSQLSDGSPLRDNLLAMVEEALTRGVISPGDSDRRELAEQILRSKQ
ncbi:hypothetical protein CFK38_00200 [Brachybacterium vulturis]|uniref:Uncharacterized protein n=1 Tax=Brachybacterium vulturis TaxID=2017484 RepID=A0A291GJ96_9MICO|nr:hypothetical protein CFK38_00200 [Brachybacterium vulturis]